MTRSLRSRGDSLPENVHNYTLYSIFQETIVLGTCNRISKKGKRKVQGVSQSQTAALRRHHEKEETDKTKQAQIEQTYKKH